MGTVYDASRKFTHRRLINNIIREGREIIREHRDGWQQELIDWKKRNKPLLDAINWETGPPYDTDKR